MEGTGEKLDVLWGVKEIAKFIGREPRQTSYMLTSGALPGRKVGERWVANRKELTKALTGEAA